MEAPTVGERLRLLRQRAGLTQVELGRLLGVAGPTISGYEKGDSSIRADELPRFAEALGAHPSEFFDPPPAAPGTGVGYESTYLAGWEDTIRRLPIHEQRAVSLAAGIVDTLLAQAG